MSKLRDRNTRHIKRTDKKTWCDEDVVNEEMYFSGVDEALSSRFSVISRCLDCRYEVSNALNEMVLPPWSRTYRPKEIAQLMLEYVKRMSWHDGLSRVEKDEADIYIARETNTVIHFMFDEEEHEFNTFDFIQTCLKGYGLTLEGLRTQRSGKLYDFLAYLVDNKLRGRKDYD